MKKIITLLVLLTSVLLLSGCSSNNSNYLKEISLKELYKKVAAKETFILELSQDGCTHCAKFNPTFIKVLEEYEVTAYYLNITNTTEDEYYKFLDDFNDGESLGTPTVIFFSEGHEKTSMNRIIGSASEKEIIRKLKQNDYIE